jgi:DNA-binding GntR family transcriptional regulator
MSLHSSAPAPEWILAREAIEPWLTTLWESSEFAGADVAELYFDLDRSSPVPLYYQVSRQIEAAIERGDLPAGARLENETGLARRWGLSRPTMRRAIQELVDKGLVVRKRGIGTQVVGHGQVKRQIQLTSLYDDLEREGRTPRTEVLSLDCDAQDDRAAAVLELPVPRDLQERQLIRQDRSR